MTADSASVITVFGANNAVEASAAYQGARDVGWVLAKLGYTVANGGYGGTMEASACGAKGAGGRTIGVTCKVWKSRPNAYIDREVKTVDLFERLRTLIDLGSTGYVALPGATGTLVELAAVWELVGKGMIEDRPIVCVGRFWQPLVEMIRAQRSGSEKHICVVDGPGDLPAHFAVVR
ncbi:MAG: LOG family protein [Phycisphaerae bacterium]|jgi:hypothetical protein|nr:LOG family protein [Phycisphaerae bacterium]MDP7636696.1 LOG family protein [Phycisphaerae bacterium]